MSDTNYTADQVIQTLQQQMEAAAKQHAQEVQEIVEHGRSTYGARNFDEASETIASNFKNPEALQGFMGVLRQCDMPADVVAHLGNNPDRAKRLAALSPARQATEIARIEAQLSSHGHVETGSERRWKDADRRAARISADDWRTNGGDTVKDDNVWSRQFDKHMAERSRRVR
jgi:hypothetical protein